jgi:2-haloacid dehalogenase
LERNPLAQVNTLTFDVFGTVIDLTGSLVAPTGRFLEQQGAAISGEDFWADWRSRQRIEQYQDNLLMLGHSGYLETCRRALVYCLRLHGVESSDDDIDQFMEIYLQLQPYADAVPGLERLAREYQLVALSNGEQWFLEHLAENNIGFQFDEVISVQRAGVFKPHPAVYRKAAEVLEREPGQIMMVAAHSFDILGARACGFRGAYVNRYRLPTEDSPYQPDLETADFLELADRLMG